MNWHRPRIFAGNSPQDSVHDSPCMTDQSSCAGISSCSGGRHALYIRVQQETATHLDHPSYRFAELCPVALRRELRVHTGTRFLASYAKEHPVPHRGAPLASHECGTGSANHSNRDQSLAGSIRTSSPSISPTGITASSDPHRHPANAAPCSNRLRDRRYCLGPCCCRISRTSIRRDPPLR